MIDIYVLLGSNIGDRKLFLHQAIAELANTAGKIMQCSAIYETQSWGKANAPDYLNQVVHMQTGLSATALLLETQKIEQKFGRERREKWGNRTLDIDILFYNNYIIDEPNLKVPHPQLHMRRFTLEPLAEIAPTLMHPVLKKTILALKTELTDDLNVKEF